MRNAMILLGLWVGIILTAYAVVFTGTDEPTPAQLALLERVADRTVVDVERRFQFQVPPGWRVTQMEDGVRLIDPLDQMKVWVVVVDDMAAPRAIRIACEWMAPCEGEGLESFQELPPPAFAERKVRITYTTDSDIVVYGSGFVRIGETVVLLVRADRDAYEARRESLDSIEQTLTVP